MSIDRHNTLPIGAPCLGCSAHSRVDAALFGTSALNEVIRFLRHRSRVAHAEFTWFRMSALGGLFSCFHSTVEKNFRSKIIRIRRGKKSTIVECHGEMFQVGGTA